MSRLRRWVPLVAVTALLGAAMLAATFANPSIETLPAPLASMLQATPSDVPTPVVGDTAESEPAEETIPPASQDSVSGTATLVFAIACGVAVLAVLILMITLLARERRRTSLAAIGALDLPLTDEETEQAIREAVEAGLTELDDDAADPRQAVIACWVRLERAAAAAGTPRERGDTSTDLVGRLLAGHAISEAVLADFAEAYREARFARRPVDEETRGRARAALRQLRDELSEEVRGG